jgi:hypothetical protein
MPLTPALAQGVAWGLTLLIEGSAVAIYAQIQRARALPLRRAVLAVLAVNLVTHPLFWWALAALPHPGPLAVTVAEAVVTGVEALLYWRLLALAPGRALALSAALNLLSWLGGITFWQIYLSGASLRLSVPSQLRACFA